LKPGNNRASKEDDQGLQQKKSNSTVVSEERDMAHGKMRAARKVKWQLTESKRQVINKTRLLQTK
jgi:hypothetical protein